MIAATPYPTTANPATDSRVFQVLSELMAATPLYIFISALRGR